MAPAPNFVPLHEKFFPTLQITPVEKKKYEQFALDKLRSIKQCALGTSFNWMPCESKKGVEVSKAHYIEQNGIREGVACLLFRASIQIPGSITEALDTVTSDITSEYRDKMHRLYANTFIDGLCMETLATMTNSLPQICIKWEAHQNGVGNQNQKSASYMESSEKIQGTDYCFLEASGIEEDTDGNEILGYCIQESIDRPEIPCILGTHGFDRGEYHLTGILIRPSNRVGMIDVTSICQTNASRQNIRRLAAIELWIKSRLYSIEKLATLIERERLSGLKYLAKWQWVPNEKRKSCVMCSKSFFYHKRHHCRACGDVFCSKCAPFRDVNIQNSEGIVKIRVCTACVLHARKTKNDNARRTSRLTSSVSMSSHSNIKSESKRKKSDSTTVLPKVEYDSRDNQEKEREKQSFSSSRSSRSDDSISDSLGYAVHPIHAEIIESEVQQKFENHPLAREIHQSDHECEDNISNVWDTFETLQARLSQIKIRLDDSNLELDTKSYSAFEMNKKHPDIKANNTRIKDPERHTMVDSESDEPNRKLSVIEKMIAQAAATEEMVALNGQVAKDAGCDLEAYQDVESELTTSMRQITQEFGSKRYNGEISDEKEENNIITNDDRKDSLSEDPTANTDQRKNDTMLTSSTQSMRDSHEIEDDGTDSVLSFQTSTSQSDAETVNKLMDEIQKLRERAVQAENELEIHRTRDLLAKQVGTMERQVSYWESQSGTSKHDPLVIRRKRAYRDMVNELHEIMGLPSLKPYVSPQRNSMNRLSSSSTNSAHSRRRNSSSVLDPVDEGNLLVGAQGKNALGYSLNDFLAMNKEDKTDCKEKVRKDRSQSCDSECSVASSNVSTDADIERYESVAEDFLIQSSRPNAKSFATSESSGLTPGDDFSSDDSIHECDIRQTLRDLGFNDSQFDVESSDDAEHEDSEPTLSSTQAVHRRTLYCLLEMDKAIPLDHMYIVLDTFEMIFTSLQRHGQESCYHTIKRSDHQFSQVLSNVPHANEVLKCAGYVELPKRFKLRQASNIPNLSIIRMLLRAIHECRSLLDGEQREVSL